MTQQIIEPTEVAGESMEVAGGEAPQTGKRSFDPSFKRNMKILGGIFGLCIAAVLFVVLRGGPKAQPQGPESNLTLGTTQRQQVDGVTPDMAQKLERKQLEEAAAAKSRGETYIPPDTVGSVQPVQPGGAGGAGPSSYAVGAAPVNAYAANSPEDQTRREGLARQLEAMLRDTSTSGAIRQRVQMDAPAAGTGQATAQATATSVSGAGAAPPAKREVVGGLTVHAGELTSDLNIPANATGFATGRITAGPAAGAFLTGTARVVDEALEITFSKMRLNGKVYSVDAKVLDVTTAGAAIAGNVDRRILQRYVYPITLAMAQGFYTAKSQTGTTVVVVGGSGSAATGLQQPAPTTEQAVAAGVSKGLELGSAEVQRQAQVPIVVSRSRGVPVGLLFNAAVTEDQ
ncbi:hypothetical protein [Ramlibacter sp. AN1133]|uniref:hypothetical protein n=1 Tax=Ramlibacter sp. AN1133 TaxID=3133429 RepID=UPI0030C5CC90